MLTWASYLEVMDLGLFAGESGTTEETVSHRGHIQPLRRIPTIDNCKLHLFRSCGQVFFFIVILSLSHQLDELTESVFALPPRLLLPEEHGQIAGEMH